MRGAVDENRIFQSALKEMLDFFQEPHIDNVWGFGKETRRLVSSSISKLFSFCQETLEWSLVLEIIQSSMSRSGDFILRDGALRPNNIKQEYLQKLGRHAKEQGIHLIAITKNSPIKLELSSSFKKIDAYLQRV